MPCDLQIYADSMAAIRDRVNKVQTILAGAIGTGDPDMDTELIFVQLRKVAEGLAYALLAANKLPYASKHRDICTVWRAKKLFERLEEVNQDFYPVGLMEPLVYCLGRKHFEPVKDGSLTKDEFRLLYDGSSGVLHSRNPYSMKSPTINIRYSVQEWVGRIQKLLALHAVRVVSGDVWITQIPNTGPVKVYPAIADPQSLVA